MDARRLCIVLLTGVLVFSALGGCAPHYIYYPEAPSDYYYSSEYDYHKYYSYPSPYAYYPYRFYLYYDYSYPYKRYYYPYRPE